MDIIFIKNLVVYTTIGVYDWEQQIKQKLIFNIEMFYDTSKASKSDNIYNTLDYSSISNDIIKYCNSTKNIKLIETLAEQISIYISNKYKISQIKIQIDKYKAVKEAESVGVIIQRKFNH